MNIYFEFITDLQYKVKSLEAKVAAFESGEKYVKMRSEYEKKLSGKDGEIRLFKSDLAAARQQNVVARNHLMEVNEDLHAEHEKNLRKKDRTINVLEKRIKMLEDKLGEAKAVISSQKAEIYQLKSELEEEKEKNANLLAQMNRDYENSSIPSSAKPKKKKIQNNREKTGNKPGGQPGHKGHGRKWYVPTNKIFIAPPEKFLDEALYKPTGNMITKQVVSLKMTAIVDEYGTPEYKNLKTGQRVHAEFPPGVVNEVNYGGSVKAFLHILTNHCAVSIDKTRELLAELTDNMLQISKGMIWSLGKEFSKKSEAERKKAFADLQQSPLMHIDFTGARVNGQSAQVAVCAAGSTVLYFAREHKGHEGVKGTPADGYLGILIHDHDITFYSYGGKHQECLDHPLRYLKGIIENEPGLTWHTAMRELLREMIHYRKGVPDNAILDEEKVKEFERKYREIIFIARREYEYEPPSKYNKDGYNLFLRMEKFEENHLLFLHDLRVPTNNNLSERLLRNLKRKLRQAISFRSFEGLENVCNALSVIAGLRAEGKNLFKSMAEIFAVADGLEKKVA
jgi:hypothetical protein